MGGKLVPNTEITRRVVGRPAEAMGYMAEALSEGIYPDLLWVVEAISRKPEQAFEQAALLMRGISPHFNAALGARITEIGQQNQHVCLGSSALSEAAQPDWVRRSSDAGAAVAWLADHGMRLVETGGTDAALHLKDDPEIRARRLRFAGFVWPVTANNRLS